jgi:hypothetical protein
MDSNPGILEANIVVSENGKVGFQFHDAIAPQTDSLSIGAVV